MKKFFACLLVVVLPMTAWAVLPGPMKDFFTARPGETTAVVFGTAGLGPELIKKVELLAYRNADYLKQRDPSRIVQIFADTAFPQEFIFNRSLVLMGSTTSNRFLAEWRNLLPYLIRDGRINVAGRKLYFGDDVTLSFVFPNPLDNDHYVFGLVGIKPWAQPSLSDGDGNYDYYLTQRHAFPGNYLNRGKLGKTSSAWSHIPTEYDPAPADTVVLVSLIYPYGKIWYPFRWELDSLWKDPIRERINLLSNVQGLLVFFQRRLRLPIWHDVDFHLSGNYPQSSAMDPFGRVFSRLKPADLDSTAFYAWSKPLSRILIPCSDAPLDWELFCHRYLAYEEFYPPRMLPLASEPRKRGSPLPTPEWTKQDPERGRRWLFDFAKQDSTYLTLLQAVDAYFLNAKIGEALDSTMEGGRRSSFKMQDFVKVLARLCRNATVTLLSKSALQPSPYALRPTYSLGIKDPGGIFMNVEPVVVEIDYGSKARAAGLRKGDKILAVDGVPTDRNRSRAYRAWLGKKKGETLKLEIMRKGTKHTIIVPVG